MATIALPSSWAVARVTPRYRHFTAMSIAPRTGSQQVFSYGGRLKLVEIAIPVLNDNDAAEFMTFLRDLKGPDAFEDLTTTIPD